MSNVGCQVKTGGLRNATSVGLVTDIAVQTIGLSIARQVRMRNPPTRTEVPVNRRRPGGSSAPETFRATTSCVAEMLIIGSLLVPWRGSRE